MSIQTNPNLGPRPGSGLDPDPTMSMQTNPEPSLGPRYADYVFSKLDTEGDGKITRERFVDGMKRNVDIIKGLPTLTLTLLTKRSLTLTTHQPCGYGYASDPLTINP